MRYWWVSQNLTYQHEIGGGYMWSPQRDGRGARNPFWETMREVTPGDVVFSFVNTQIRAVGITRSYCYESPKPAAFGIQWDNVGWRVDVLFRERDSPIKPADHMNVLRPLLPAQYSPLQPSGRGNQMYLAELPRPMALVLADLVGSDVGALCRQERALDIKPQLDAMQAPPATLLWEQELQRRISEDTTLPDTERVALVSARRGQGLFKARVRAVEHRCRVTLVENIEHLVASHCKPWRDSTNEERLSAENGLLLTPSIDHLFDRGFISFEDKGRLLISGVADRESLKKMGVETEARVDVGVFTQGQRRYLEYHREHVFLERNAA
jgi:putative restriction endonuclease